MSTVSCRKFLSAGVGGAAAAGIGYLTKDYWYPLTQRVISPKPAFATPTPVETKVNSPPYANFELKRPIYIRPCVGQEVQFLNKSTDPDGDPLTYRWYVDDKLESESKDFSTRFNEIGQHSVRLEVSDGKLKDKKEYSFIDVETDQIFPTKPLYVKYKGVRYFAGSITYEWPNIPSPSTEEMDEQLDTIRDDLGCNAIIICGGEYSEDRMIECGRMALEKRFERIYV
ncbi:PKD domain-containing protein [Candidatus Bathyarchaeota archaeon]|nr:PKD domain-containing protein [Candidatus Bathyarchaeota archaeon]